jgi:hypothetical protein
LLGRCRIINELDINPKITECPLFEMRKLTVIIDDSDMSHSVLRDTTKKGKKRPVSKPDRHTLINAKIAIIVLDTQTF